MDNKKAIKIEISTNVIWKTILILLLLWFLFLVRDILLLLFLAIVIVSAIQPFVDRMERKRVPRALSTILVYIVFIFLFGLLVYLIAPVLTEELNQFAQDIPKYLQSASNFLENIVQIAADYNFEEDLRRLISNSTNSLTDSLSGVFSNSLQFLGNFFKVIIVASLSFYMLVKKDGTKGFLQNTIPKKYQEYTIGLVERIQKKIGRWLIGQVTLILIIFGLDYLALYLMGVPFALIIAIFGGLLEIIPFIGPTIAVIPAALAALTISPLTMIFIIIAYIAIQQVENHLLTPLIMRSAVGLNPVVIILVLLIGGTLAGVPGVFLAVPFAAAADIFLSDLIDKKNIF